MMWLSSLSRWQLHRFAFVPSIMPYAQITNIMFPIATATQVQPTQHNATATVGCILQLPRSGNRSNQMTRQQSAVQSITGVEAESAFPQLQTKFAASDARNRRENTASADCISGGSGSGSYGGNHNLDHMNAESLSALLQAQIEQGGGTQPRHTRTSYSAALLRRSGTGIQQAGGDIVPRLLAGDGGSRLSALPYNSATGATRSASQNAVQEALAAAKSTAVSAGDEHMAEVLENMQRQLLRTRISQ